MAEAVREVLAFATADDVADAAAFLFVNLAAQAVRDQSSSLLVRALTEQRLALQALGHDAGVPIVTDEVAALAEAAISEAAAVLPAGAGGGDVAIFVAAHPPSERLKHLALALNHNYLPLNLGVRGVHSAASEC